MSRSGGVIDRSGGRGGGVGLGCVCGCMKATDGRGSSHQGCCILLACHADRERERMGRKGKDVVDDVSWISEAEADDDAEAEAEADADARPQDKAHKAQCMPALTAYSAWQCRDSRYIIMLSACLSGTT